MRLRRRDRRGDAHGFDVRCTKFQPVDERRRILSEANRGARQLTGDAAGQRAGDPREVARRMMKERIRAGWSYGKRDDEWILHPVPTMLGLAALP